MRRPCGPGEPPCPTAINRLLGGLAFCLGLILVVVGGAELFTGNNLIVMAWASRKVTTGRCCATGRIVYIGNFVGALLTVVLMLLAKQYLVGKGAIGLKALQHRQRQSRRWIRCRPFSWASCVTRWSAWRCGSRFSARTTTDKILAIIFPITAFVAAGFEHSVANMYFIPMGLLIKQFAPAAFWATDTLAKATPAVTIEAFSKLTWGNFFINNLIPVTLGNIVGGAGMVGLIYWFVYLRPRDN